MSGELTSRLFKVSLDGEAKPGTMEVLLDFVEIMDERRLTLWEVMMRRTFVLLTLVGGTGGDVVSPNDTRIRLLDYEIVEAEGSTIVTWTFDQLRFDISALRIVCNLIEHATYNIGVGDEPIGSPIAEVMFISPGYEKIKFDALSFPKQWKQLPFKIEDHEPETRDIDIEIEFQGAPEPDVFDLYETTITPWFTTLEKGGFLGHPLQSWRFGLDTSEERFRRTSKTLIIQIRDFYSDYAALDCLFNVLVRAHEIHPIDTVIVGD